MSNEEIKNIVNKRRKNNLELCDEKIEWITKNRMSNGGKYVEKRKYLRIIFHTCLVYFKEDFIFQSRSRLGRPGNGGLAILIDFKIL